MIGLVILLCSMLFILYLVLNSNYQSLAEKVQRIEKRNYPRAVGMIRYSELHSYPEKRKGGDIDVSA